VKVCTDPDAQAITDMGFAGSYDYGMTVGAATGLREP